MLLRIQSGRIVPAIDSGGGLGSESFKGSCCLAGESWLRGGPPKPPKKCNPMNRVVIVNDDNDGDPNHHEEPTEDAVPHR